MSLLTDWRDKAYDKDMDEKFGKTFWAKYFEKEKAVYEKLCRIRRTL